MSVLVDLSPRAHREAARIARWWRANRPSAPDLFDQELHVVLMQIATAPNSGAGEATQAGRGAMKRKTTRASSAFTKLKAGLEDAIAHHRGSRQLTVRNVEAPAAAPSSAAA